jgi:hypothetical protein
MSKQSARINPLFAIFCDDVRREDNGKELLIGVYSGSLQLPILPAPVMLSVWVPFERSGIGKVPIEFRLLGPDDRIVGYGTIELNFTESDYTVGSLPLRGLAAMLVRPGEITFQLRQHDESWATVRKLSVEKREAPNRPI